MGWKQYAFAVLAFNAALFVISFAILLLQSHLPILNPDGKGSLTALGYKDMAGAEHPGADTAVIFNTVCSFVTNTNLQHYSGEQHLSYFSQLGAIVWLQFVTPACGLAVMLAVIRGLRGQRELGDFYLDTLRGLCFVLVPLSVIVAVLLVATGVPMTLAGSCPGDHTRARDAKRSPSARGGRGRHQAARYQRRRLLRAQLGAPVRKPQPLEQPARSDLDHHRAHGVDRHVRPDDQGPGARDGDLWSDAGHAL